MEGEAMHWVKLTLADEPVGIEGAALCYMVYGARHVATAHLRVGYESRAQFSANTAVCLAHRVHATSPGRLPQRLPPGWTRNEAWRKGLARKQARPE